MKVLNEAFGRTPFQFRIMEVKFEVDDLFYSQFLVNDKGEHSGTPGTFIQRFPRRGDYSTLNLYFGGIDMPFSFSYLPSPGGLNSVPWDGAYIFLGSVPKVYSVNQTGATTVHEVGHWLGLLHVFQSTTKKQCDPNDKNDYVSDTPQMADFEKGTDGKCPSNYTDTCKNLWGKDPIHNYMDYSSDLCMSEFTPGQIKRMYFIWSIYRNGKEECSRGQGRFEFEMLPDKTPGETFWVLQTKDGKTIWKSRPAENGLPGASLKDSRPLSQDLCLDDHRDYIFTIYDAGRNGIAAPGYYTIRYNGIQIKRGGTFRREESSYFHGRPMSAPTKASGTYTPGIKRKTRIPSKMIKPNPSTSKHSQVPHI